MVIVMVNSVSMGSSLAFSTTAAVVYSSKNTTNLNEVLDDEQTSWLGMLNFQVSTNLLIKNQRAYSLAVHCVSACIHRKNPRF